MQENSPREMAHAEAPNRMERGLAVCFCGGQSERMGQDKALLPGPWDRGRVEQNGAVEPSFRGTLLAHGLERLEALHCSEVVLASGTATPRYPKAGKRELPDASLESGSEAGGASGGGPLAGLVAALEEGRRLGLDWIFVLACDLPRARVETMRLLVDHALETGADVCLSRTTGSSESDDSGESARIHPLFAFYSMRCLGPARRALQAGRRRMISFHDPQFSTSHDRVDSTAGCDPRQLQIETFEVPIEEATNLNTPLDYERERAAAPSASGERENGNS